MFLLVTLRALAQEPPPIVNGEPTDAHPAVVTLLAVDDAGEGENFCTGTLIAPSWVLTAGHCLLVMEEHRGTRTPNLVVAFGDDLGREGGVHAVVAAADAFLPDGFDGARFVDDLGLVELASPVTDVQPMPVSRDAPTECQVGEELRYVGWGTVDDAALDTTVKRAADIPLYDYDDAFLYGYDPEEGQNTCAGDSGGPALRILGGDRYTLAAVNAYVTDDDDTPCAGGYTAGTRVDRHVAWIERYTPVTGAEEVDPESTSEGCPGADGVPVFPLAACAAASGPASGWGLLLGAALACRRRMTSTGR